MPTSITPGNIPNLVKQGFAGNVWCTPATRNLCVYMLLDSGHIQESDIEYLNKRRKRDGYPPVEPLYTQADAQAGLTHFVSVGLHRPSPWSTASRRPSTTRAISSGSAWVALDIKEFATGKQWRADLQRRHRPPRHGHPERSGAARTAADILMMESTYGDRLHPTRGRGAEATARRRARHGAAPGQGHHPVVRGRPHAGDRLRAERTGRRRRYSAPADLRRQPAGRQRDRGLPDASGGMGRRGAHLPAGGGPAQPVRRAERAVRPRCGARASG